MKRTIIGFTYGLGICVIVATIPMIRNLLKPKFPWERLVVSDASISSSISYNPYSDYPPKHRWELTIAFEELDLGSNRERYAPFITYSLNLDDLGWKGLAGVHNLNRNRGSDFWLGDDNLGPVYLDRIEVKSRDAAQYEVVVNLAFAFEDGAYKAESKRLFIPVNYKGLNFMVPTWSKPNEVSFPPSWGVPSSKQQWTDQEIKEFVRRYVDFSQYTEPKIDHAKGSSALHADPK